VTVWLPAPPADTGIRTRPPRCGRTRGFRGAGRSLWWHASAL